MSGSNEKPVLLNLADLGLIEKVAVNEKSQEILIGDFKEHKVYIEGKLGNIDKNTAEIFALIRTFPEKITACRDDLEKDIHLELEKHYATETTLRLIESELNNKIDQSNARFKWTVGIIVSLAGVVQFFTTIWFMSLQLSKLTGG